MRTLVYCLTVFLVFSIQLTGFAQQKGIQTDPFVHVEVGANKYYSIRQADGTTVKAKIISTDPNRTLVLAPDGTSYTINTKDIVAINEQSHNSPGSIGVGFGLPYGLLGINADIKLYKVLYATGGIGTGIYVTPIYNVGLRCFMTPGTKKLRPRASVYYGTYGMLYLEDSYSETIKDTFTGFTLGLGLQYAIDIVKAWGVDFEILYIVDDSKMETTMQDLKNQGYSFDTESTGNVKVSLGIRYVF